MKKTFILVVIILIFGVLFIAGGTIAREKATARSEDKEIVASAFTADSTDYDFGTISMRRGKVSRSFTITNASSKPITVRKITTSCMCTEAFLTNGEERKGPFGMQGHGFSPPVNETILAGKDASIEVVFDPAAHGPAGVGKIERAVFVEDENGGVQIFGFKALVTP